MDVAPSADALLDPEHRGKVFLHTVHDGDFIPARFRQRPDGRPIVAPDVLSPARVRERDWGANLVAHHIAEQAGLGGYGCTRIARVLLDFNRFPGTTPPGHSDPLERLAINPPYSIALTHAEKMDLLDVYDEISDAYEAKLSDRLILIGVHTYDEHNPSATSRPHLSIVTQPLGYQRHAKMPYGVFDPIYPDVLGESSCSRILRDRMSLNLERRGFRVSSNHPYALPEGSIEVRSQVWYFFSYVHRRFVAELPETADDPAYALVWRMLLNTNLRQAEPEALRGFLHRYRKPVAAQVGAFERAQKAYERVREFVTPSLVRDYRRSPDRPSSLALEVRKDLLCELDSDGRPLPASDRARERARVIGEVVAKAIQIYLEVDRDEQHYDPA